jgi:hypothetical protein
MFLFVGFECVTSTSSRPPFAVFGFASQSLSISLRVLVVPFGFDGFDRIVMSDLGGWLPREAKDPARSASRPLQTHYRSRGESRQFGRA